MTGRVLVTGATGFLGAAVLEPLARRGFEVHAAGAADLLDVREAERLVEAVAPTHLLHLAWARNPMAADAEDHAAWERASVALVRAFARRPEARRAIIAGSCAEYHWSAGICDETATPLAPRTAYGRSKRALAVALADLASITIAWPRIFFVYGPREHEHRLVAAVARALLAGERVAVSSGQQRRDYLHVDDVADALAAVAASGVEGPINVGSGSAVEVRRLVELVAETAGRPDLVDWGARTADGEPALVQASVARLRDDVGWRPSIGLEDGITDTVEWWRTVAT